MNAPEFIKAIAAADRNGDKLSDELKSAFSGFPDDTRANLAKTLNQDYPAFATELGVAVEKEAVAADAKGGE